MITDFLGNEVKPGMKVIFYGPWGLRSATIQAVDETKGRDCIKILGDGLTKPGWTRSSRVIVNDKKEEANLVTDISKEVYAISKLKEGIELVLGREVFLPQTLIVKDFIKELWNNQDNK